MLLLTKCLLFLLLIVCAVQYCECNLEAKANMIFTAQKKEKEFKCYSYTKSKMGFEKLKLEVNETALEGTLSKAGLAKMSAKLIPAGSGGKHADASMDIAVPLQHRTAYSYPASEGQDSLVLKLLQYKKSGFYIDVGARYWHKGSNTFALDYFFGWSGICIEPDGHFYRGLAINRTCAVVCNNPVDSIDGSVKQFSYQINGAQKEGNDNEKKVTVSLNTVFNKLGKRVRMPPVVDYLSIDIEGWEYHALRAVNFDAYVFLIISIERPTIELHQLLASKGYWWLTQVRSPKSSNETLNVAPIRKAAEQKQKSQSQFNPAHSGYFGECIYIHRSIPNFHQIMGEYRPKAVHFWRWAMVVYNGSYLSEPAEWTSDVDVNVM
jgi:hypothetical protein